MCFFAYAFFLKYAIYGAQNREVSLNSLQKSKMGAEILEIIPKNRVNRFENFLKKCPLVRGIVVLESLSFIELNQFSYQFYWQSILHAIK